MPSMETLVASEVRHVNTTWSPAEMLDGVAVSCAVGAGATAAGGAVSAGGSGFSFFLQPAAPIKATRGNTGTKKRRVCFKRYLLLRLRQNRGFWVLCDAQQALPRPRGRSDWKDKTTERVTG